MKIEALRGLDICWHFIGPMQSNKTRPIAEHFDWVHSVDRAKIARRLSEQRPHTCRRCRFACRSMSRMRPVSPASPGGTAAIGTGGRALPNLVLRGLMAIPEASNDPERTAQCLCTTRMMHWLNCRRWRRPWIPCLWVCPATWKPQLPKALPWCASGLIFSARATGDFGVRRRVYWRL